MLIGYNIYIKDTGLSGRVVDETKNTIVVESHGVLKRVIKDENRFVVYANAKEVRIRGGEIKLRPWEYAI